MKKSKKRVGEPLEIENLYVALSRSPAGDEGIVANITPMGALPLVMSNMDILERILKDCGQGLASAAGEEILVVRFSRARVLRVIKP